MNNLCVNLNGDIQTSNNKKNEEDRMRRRTNTNTRASFTNVHSQASNYNDNLFVFFYVMHVIRICPHIVGYERAWFNLKTLSFSLANVYGPNTRVLLRHA